jgi:hypothetical protein
MKISSNTKKTAETENSCEFCKRSFIKETTLLKHICEYKHRWLERDKHGNRIGFQSWLQFYTRHSASKKVRTYEDFIKSAYYTAFAKFGTYCVDINALNVPRYVDYLLKEKIKIDTWATDTNYNKFLIEYLTIEDPLDAIHRSVETCLNMGNDQNIQPNDVLRYGNRNKILYAITTGKISPWLLYQSESGVKLLDELSPDQIKMVYDYINPVKWAIMFTKDQSKVNEVKSLLKELRY